MSDHENRQAVERLLAALTRGDWAAVEAGMTEDAVVEWPQSGERLVGRSACLVVYQNYPGGPPAYGIRRLTGSGDTFTAEAIGDYGGQKVFMTSIIELAGGKVARMTDYFSYPFEAPAWRSQWVERMEYV